MEIELLAEHYNGQLAQAGWQRIDAGHTGPAGWSTWRFQDDENDPWSGVFFVLHVNRRPEYALYIYIRAEDDKIRRQSGVGLYKVFASSSTTTTWSSSSTQQGSSTS